MKSLPLIFAALALATGAAVAKPVADPPSAAQLSRFYAACVEVAPAAAVLCRCKQQAAPKLIDAAFMDIVIASMQGRPLDARYYDAYNTYIGRSNQLCKPDY